ncbi:TetR/AcrR family transcriptional regulator [Nocardia barduliensis]|uniref:TetR/AcrR family transcriptional regulator n=1 Tax=Nocardia barduliensis TaxID=2736643 RepID=UPI001571B5C4|nr:TetR/AcrR family transcriptional regulator [Nocardia barduliensis]
MSTRDDTEGRSATPTGPRPRHSKKHTRDTIRAVALRLFTEQGFKRTTVEQIAREVGVSHMTVFRHFPTKEMIILDDGLGPRMEELMRGLPKGLPIFDLTRQLVTGLYALGTADPWARNAQRRQLIDNEPELRAAAQAQGDHSFGNLARFFAEYTGREPDELAVRVFTAALTGVLLHVMTYIDDLLQPGTLDEMIRAIDLLEQGLPL